MKALTIKQPWAWLVATGIKNIENRSWKTNYRGKIYIHAGALKDDVNVWDLPGNQDQRYCIDWRYSSIIGTVNIIDCVENHQSHWAMPGMYHWVLSDADFFLNPIKNVKGKLRLWEYKGESIK